MAEQRQEYLDAGWVAFREGRFPLASSRFRLAASAGMGAPRETAEAKLALLYAGFAGRQYAEAGNTLQWLIRNMIYPDPAVDCSLAELIPDLPSKYGRPSELNEDLRALADRITQLETARRAAGQRPEDKSTFERLSMELANARSIRAFVYYAIPSQRSMAVLEARSLVRPSDPTADITRLLAEPGTSKPLSSQPDNAPAAPQFPLNLFQEAPPQALSERSNP